MVTPLPNITVYYTGYRIYSHLRALQARHRAASGRAPWVQRGDQQGALQTRPCFTALHQGSCTIPLSALPTMQGAKALEQSLEQLNSKQLQELRVAVRLPGTGEWEWDSGSRRLTPLASLA